MYAAIIDTFYNNNYQDGDQTGDFFGSLADGINHSVPIRRVNKDLYHRNCFSGIPRTITFSLVQATAGDVVSLSYSY